MNKCDSCEDEKTNLYCSTCDERFCWACGDHHKGWCIDGQDMEEISNE